MRHPSQKTGASSALFKNKGQTFGAGFYLLVSLVIFISSTIETDSLNKARRMVGDFVAPVIEALGAPIVWTSNTIHWMDNVVRVFTINQELKAENQSLKEWQGVAQVLSLENKRLKELLGRGDFAIPTLVTARVVGIAGGPYVRSVLVDKGLNDGVVDGRAVVDENGLVGRIILMGNSASRVLLINDLNSRVPVRVERSNQNAMVIGLNDELMGLMFYPVGAEIIIGDRLFTSGDGRAYPPDILVGTVVEIENDTISIRPAAELDRLDFVRVLSFDASILEPLPQTIYSDDNSPSSEGGQE